MKSSPEVKMEMELIQETVDTVTLPKTVSGVVVNCAKLNVREEPSADAEVVCVLDVMSEIRIDATKSDNEWFKICTASGVEGYCMRKFVDAYL
jgi:SH3-like domain-containing protein